MLILREQLLSNPKSGIPLGSACYKVRLSISSKHKGKSGGARVITHLLLVNDNEGIIYLLAIYDKSEQENISDKQILELLKEIQ
ncbi:type II toxin-antitoxin system RelE/ParE family toxin [Mucilaginibacter sp.]|uniref:type II toxin-antitoxin system RelE/ParE family toxin n=1 Tax=Mucilaginibacter sp. TaxID=1882438 RepID=UPI003264BBD2